MSSAVWAFGTQLKKGLAETPIAELTAINGLDLTSDEVDITNHDSTGGFEEVMMTLKRTGSVSIEGNFLPGDAGQAALLADFLSTTKDTYKIVFPADLGAEWEFEAYVKKPPSTEAPIDNVVPFTAELRVTGEPSLNVDESADLSGLTASGIVPAFAATTYRYTAVVLTGVSTYALTPAGAGTIKVNGETVLTGVEKTVALGAAGTTTDIYVDHQETGKIAKRYWIAVTRAAS